MNHLDLFSGIGGFTLASNWAGLKTIQFVENDPFCQQVLNKNFLEVPIHGDIRTFKWRGGEVFLLTAGVPCQPASIAGQRKGREDDRWLWPEALRILSEVKPRWALFENPTGVLSLEGGLVFENLLSEMENQNYKVWATIIPACAKNAPHRRDRVWIIANLNNSGCNGETISVCRKEQEEISLFAGAISNATNSINTRLQRSIYRRKSKEKTKKFASRRNKVTRNSKGSRQQGSISRPRKIQYGGTGSRENWVKAAARLCGMDDGISKELYKLETSDRVERIKALGNSIVPQIAYEIIQGIVETERILNERLN